MGNIKNLLMLIVIVPVLLFVASLMKAVVTVPILPVNEPKDYANVQVAYNDFGFTLLRTLNKTNSGENNIFISPVSIETAFSMLLNGSNGNTYSQLLGAMKLANFDQTQVNESNQYLAQRLNGHGDGIKLTIANSIWHRNTFSVEQDFLDVNKKYYDAQISALDFRSPGASKEINSWVSQKTNSLIKEIVPSDIPNDMVMYLINAIYFKGTWSKQFEKSATQKMKFYLSNNQTVMNDFMYQSGDYSYFEDSDMQVVKLPYGKEKSMSMIIMLPKDTRSVEKLLSSLSSDYFDKYLLQMRVKKGDITIPKFKTEYSTSLISSFIELGAKDVFDSNKADLTKINKQENLFVSDALHKSYIDVNEEGTEAAAVTSIGISTTSMPVRDDYFEFVADHPFVYAIYDEALKGILFLGITQDPTK